MITKASDGRPTARKVSERVWAKDGVGVKAAQKKAEQFEPESKLVPGGAANCKVSRSTRNFHGSKEKYLVEVIEVDDGA